MSNKNKRKFLLLGLIRMLFPLVEKVLPFLAKRWGNKLFFTPFRFNAPEREVEIINRSSKFTIKHNKLNIQGFEWGEGPIIFLMHGWAGRAGQFSEFVEPLVKKGFKVIAFDALGHGLSEGKETHLLEFAETVKKVVEVKGPVFGAIGHSLGGTALLLARKRGLELEKIITISVPSIASGIITEFLKKINGSPKIGDSIRKYVYKRFNQSFDEFSASHIVAQNFPKTDILIVHDENDTEAPKYHYDELKKLLPKAKYILTKGFGHNRILRDEETIKRIVDFLKQYRVEEIVEQNEVLSKGVMNK